MIVKFAQKNIRTIRYQTWVIYLKLSDFSYVTIIT